VPNPVERLGRRQSPPPPQLPYELEWRRPGPLLTLNWHGTRILVIGIAMLLYQPCSAYEWPLASTVEWPLRMQSRAPSFVDEDYGTTPLPPVAPCSH
jgi:hypothetical protein